MTSAGGTEGPVRLDDPAVRDILRRARVARIATLSRNGRPSINPLYFVRAGGRIWLGTAEWTLAARNVQADPRVSVLFTVEADPGDRRVLRIRGRGTVRTDRRTLRAHDLRVALRYVLAPGALRHLLAHAGKLRLRRAYHRQNADRGAPCVIEVIPEEAELLTAERPG